MSDSPREIVEDFLDRLADPNRRETVQELYSDNVKITRPGASYSGPEGVSAYLEGGNERYEQVDKNIEWWVEDGSRIVCGGTLFGVTGDGVEFDGIRFVDAFVVENGEIIQQDVYNDIYMDGIL